MIIDAKITFFIVTYLLNTFEEILKTVDEEIHIYTSIIFTL